MVIFKRIRYFLLLFGLLTWYQSPVYAQQTDISALKIDLLSDDQVEELIKRAQEAGLSTNDFLQMAQMRGMPSVEVEKLRDRIEGLNINSSNARTAVVSKRNPRTQLDLNDITRGLTQTQELSETEEVDDQLFGSNLFFQKNRKLSFEPSLNQATPKSYVLGPGDLIYVDIFGQS